jgi:hypothetical protein
MHRIARVYGLSTVARRRMSVSAAAVATTIAVLLMVSWNAANAAGINGAANPTTAPPAIGSTGSTGSTGPIGTGGPLTSSQCNSGNACLWFWTNYNDGSYGPGYWSSGGIDLYTKTGNGASSYCQGGTWGDCGVGVYNNGVNDQPACWLADSGPEAGTFYTNEPGSGTPALPDAWGRTFAYLYWAPSGWGSSCNAYYG